VFSGELFSRLSLKIAKLARGNCDVTTIQRGTTLPVGGQIVDTYVAIVKLPPYQIA
jgi:hypothetical protein